MAWAAMSLPAGAQTSGDTVYIHCQKGGGDFSISELNRTVRYFSDRYQQYRPVCRDCTIASWDNEIVLRDGTRTVAKFDRVSGRIWIRGQDAKPVPGSFAVTPFHGTCTIGSPVVPRPGVLTARAF